MIQSRSSYIHEAGIADPVWIYCMDLDEERRPGSDGLREGKELVRSTCKHADDATPPRHSVLTHSVCASAAGAEISQQQEKSQCQHIVI